MEDAIITGVENISGQLHIYIELPRTPHICSVCGASTDRIHDYRMQTIKDVPLGRDTFLHLRKRRYRCSCGKRFFEKNTFLPQYYRVTSRLVAEVMFSFKKLIPATEIGSHFKCTHAYHKWFNEILNSMDVPWTNGFIEGCNNKAKVLSKRSIPPRLASHPWL